MKTIPSAIPDSEELDGLSKCFECGRLLTPETPHGLDVAEGIELCERCCLGERRHEPNALPGWFDDLAGRDHHT